MAAFRKKGHEAFSCDIKDCSGDYPDYHIKGDVMEVISDGWDLLIGHPPCTYLSYAGTRHWNAPGRLEKRLEALDFFAKLWEAPVERICLENPKGCASPTIAKYSQEIQPYYFGDPYMKTTWLWLKNLPKLEYSLKPDLFNPGQKLITKPEPIYVDANGKKRHFTEAQTGDKNGATIRSKTFKGIAAAMAEQWG
ncbi:hypothetical protein [Tenacibaculum singaporense]|uniref:hypothetical protein n=1 Tax=Tenacibaculum singaporense TaxID=2358479 RepID=UPI001AC009B6|nr:hypothetical protein [Tenacibaculum singaporense]